MIIGDVHLWEDYVLEDEDLEDDSDSEANTNSKLQRKCVEYLQSMPYAFISPNAQRNLMRLREGLSMIGRDVWTDSIAMTNTSSAPALQMIFDVDLHFCADLWSRGKYTLAADVLIGAVLALQCCAGGFWTIWARCGAP